MLHFPATPSLATGMRTESRAVSLLGLLPISCVTAPSITPTPAEELTRLVLLLNDSPGGEATHTWQRAEDFDLSPYRGSVSARVEDPRTVLTMGGQRDCDEENRTCLRECMSRPLPHGYGHITVGGRGRGGKEVYCNEKCMQPYRDCTKLQELQPREFTAVDTAVEWLKHHRDLILVGNIVIVAGVAFVVVSSGVGAVILVPAVLLSAPVTSPAIWMVEDVP